MQRALYALVGVFVLIIAGGLALPRFARVEVSAVVDAPPAVVFAQANDFRRLVLWAPPQAGDPDARISYLGPARGEGARVEWDGPISGGGTQVVVESIPYEYVSYLLNPGESSEAAAWFEITPVAEGTRISRGFEHDYGYNLVGRYFGVLWAGMIRRDYHLSLERLRALLDGLPGIDFSDLEVAESYVEATNIAYVVTSGPVDSVADREIVGVALDEVAAYLAAAGLEATGPARVIRRDAIGSRRRLDAAMPFAGEVPEAAMPSNVMFGRGYEGHIVQAQHSGRPEELAATYEKLTAYITATGRRPNGDPWVSFSSSTEAGRSDLTINFPVLAD